MQRTLRSFFIFGLVGTLGFIIDTCILYALLDILGAYMGRVVSFSCSVFCTWQLNRRFTFNNHASNRNVVFDLAYYFLLMLLGGGANLGVYSLLVAHFSECAQNPVLGVAAGSLAGLLFNFFSSRFLLYSRTAHD